MKKKFKKYGSGWQLLKMFLVFFLVFAALYRLQIVSPFLDHYYFLSQSLSQGKLEVTEQIKTHFGDRRPEWDYAIVGDKYFAYLGVFPAVLGLPLLALGPATYQTGLYLTFLFLTIYILAKIIKHFLKNIKNEAVFALMIVIGSPILTNIVFPGPWYLASLVASGLGMLFLWLYKIKSKNWSILLIAPMFLTIPVTIFYALIPLADIFKKNSKQKSQKQLILALTLAAALFTWGAYNYGRFGNPLESGYKYGVVIPEKHIKYRQQESPITVTLSNAIYYLFNPPRVHQSQALRITFPFFELSRYGVGLLFCMPWFLAYLFCCRQKKRDRAYLTAILLIMLSIFYFSGGGTNQIGPRHANDFLPLLIFVFFQWLAKNPRHLPLFKKLLAISVFLNLYFYGLVITGHLRSF